MTTVKIESVGESVELNGVTLTPEMIATVVSWYDYDPDIEDSIPERFYRYLNDAQDFLCRIIVDPENDEQMKFAVSNMSNIVYIKDELKHFFPIKKGARCDK